MIRAGEGGSGTRFEELAADFSSDPLVLIPNSIGDEENSAKEVVEMGGEGIWILSCDPIRTRLVFSSSRASTMPRPILRFDSASDELELDLRELFSERRERPEEEEKFLASRIEVGLMAASESRVLPEKLLMNSRGEVKSEEDDAVLLFLAVGEAS